MKINNFFPIVILALFYSCSSKQNEVETSNNLFGIPKTYPLNTQGGYKINPVSGDSILPIINSLGDTIKTGVPISITGKIIDPVTIDKPNVVHAGNPEIVPTKNNVLSITKNIITIPVDDSKLKRTKLGEGDSSFVLKNSSGVIIPTGIPIPVIGKKVLYKKPPLIPALPMRSKDGATYNIQFLDIEQGMNNSYVYCVLEDRRGNFWFGTDGGGVSCYDGTSMSHYTMEEGLINNSIRCILEDKSGNLWFGADGGGISRFDGKYFLHYTEKEGLPRKSIRSMLEDKKGNLWVGTSEGGVTRFDGKYFTHYTTREGLLNNTVRSILEDKNGNLWFGTKLGVSRFDGKSFTHYTEEEGLSENMVASMEEDKKGNIWFGTWEHGVSWYDGTSFRHFAGIEGLSNNGVLSMQEDLDGNLWFGMNGDGVFRFNGSTMTNFREKEGLSHNTIYSIQVDEGGTLWFGTWGGGVSKYKETSFTHYSTDEGLSNNRVNCILEDTKGNLWFATVDGVEKYDGTSFKKYSKSEGLCDNYIYSILEDKRGNFWFGTQEGVSRFDGTFFTNYSEKEGLSNKDVYCMTEDNNGNIWFGTSDGGLTKFDGVRFTHFTEKEGFINNSVWSIMKDHNGNIWAGTDRGVTRIDGINFTYYTEKEGLNNNKIYSIAEDKNGILWFGSQGSGVSKFNGSNFTNYTMKEGLSDNLVWSIIENREGNLWVATENGLNYFDFEDGKSIGNQQKIIGFGKQDGLRSVSFLQSALIDRNNHAWWGSGNSLVSLDLNKFTFPIELSTIYLRQLNVNDQFIDYHLLLDSTGKKMDYDSVSTFENYPLHLELPFNKNHITFHYSAIDWAAPHKLKYSYTLEGLNGDWSAPSEELKADYQNLSHGKYTFKVKAIGAAQKWSKPFEYTFTILPPWWLTKWAYLFYLILLFSGAYMMDAYFKKRILQKEKERNREKELAQAKEIEMAYSKLKATQAQLIQSAKMASLGELTAGIAHEIQNPLNFVKNFSELNSELIVDMQQEIDHGNLNAVKSIAQNITINEQKIVYHGKRADAIVKGMLQHSRNSTGLKEPTDINALADEYLRLAYHGLRAKNKSFNATMLTDFDPSIGKIDIFPQDIGRVMLNLITNAFYSVTEKNKEKPNGYEPTVSISTKKLKSAPGNPGTSSSVVEIKVRDNGNGIPQHIIDKIFQPFFTTKPTGQGTGLGLSLSYDIIKAHGGELNVETKEGEYAEFTIRLNV